MKQIVPVTQPLPEAERSSFFALRDVLVPKLQAATEITRDVTKGG
jgi:hypothetical protein